MTIPLDDKAFRYWNDPAGRWPWRAAAMRSGWAAPAHDIQLTATVTVAASGDANPYEGLTLPHYQSGQVQDVPDEEFTALLGHPIPVSKVAIDRNMTLGEIAAMPAARWAGWCM